MELNDLKQIISGSSGFGNWEAPEDGDSLGLPRRQQAEGTENAVLEGLPVTWRQVTQHAWSWRIPGVGAGSVTSFGDAWTATVRELRGEPDFSGIQARAATRNAAVRLALWPNEA